MNKIGTALFIAVAAIIVASASFFMTSDAEARIAIRPNPGGGGCYNASVETCSEHNGLFCTGSWNTGWNVEVGSSYDQCLDQLQSMVNQAHQNNLLTRNAHCWWGNACSM